MSIITPISVPDGRSGPADPWVETTQRLGLSFFELDFRKARVRGAGNFFAQYGRDASADGWSFDQWIGHVRTEDRPALAAYLEKVDTDAGPIDIRVDSSDGETRWLRLSARAEHDRAGVPLHGRGIQVDTTESRDREERYRAAASRDHLTGLHNRAGFLDAIESADPDSGGRIALILIDLDRFKAVNDHLGHPAGDVLLRQVAGRLRSCIADGDVAARLGGDEFAILRAAGDTAEDTAGRIVDLMSRQFLVLGRPVSIGASAGIAYVRSGGDRIAAVMRQADLALYEAKYAGRGCWRVYEPGMGARADAENSMLEDLRRAIPLGEMEVHFQPRIDVVTGSLASFEALLRWNRGGRGLVSPVEFVPLAEENGLIGALGRWVLRKSCQIAAGWPSPLGVSVNVSPRQFETGSLVAHIAEALETSRLAPERLEIELTEAALVRGEERVVEQLHQIRAMGVRLAMDDFGVGYSSLSRLLAFQFDCLKVDRSFVAALGGDLKAQALVSSIASLGSNLAMRTVAEGVESNAQADFVRARGFDEMQGFLISKPMPELEVRRFIEKRLQGPGDSDAR